MTPTTCQQTALDAAKSGANLCITGPAGTGKSTLLQWLRQDPDFAMAVTATTGVAAVGVRGVTINSWAGLALADAPAEQIVNDVRCRPKVMARIKGAFSLAIDEISMASPELVDKLDYVLKDIRGRQDRPFGGLQMFFFGDFLQLPPVTRGSAPPKFAFDAESWKNIRTIQLNTVMRQADEAFVHLLHRARKAQLTAEDVETLRGRVTADRSHLEGFEPVKLYSKNLDVDAVNIERLRNLNTQAGTFAYDAKDSGEPAVVAAMQKHSNVPQQLFLRVGAQVMLLKNLDLEQGLANGSLGVVERFSNGWPVVRFRNGFRWTAEPNTWEIKVGGNVVATREQLPLRLAWAITIHKSQGATLDLMEADLSNCFERGQAYVALSRAKTMDGLFLSGFSPDSVKAHPRALEFYEKSC